MTSSLDPITSSQDRTHDVLRRVEALRPELPERAEVTVDFGRYPIPDVPYITIVQWSLSSAQDWPLLAEKRDAGTRSATRGLTDDEVRHVLYYDLKRSLWRPAPKGVALDWDDQDLRLTLKWSPRELAPDALPVFATLASALKPSTRTVIDALPESVEAFRQATSEASGPAEAPKPAFRVAIGDLVLAEGPTSSGQEQAQRLYDELEEASNPDAKVSFNDEALTIEFADFNAIVRSGLHDSLLDMARSPQFGSPSTHPGAPRPEDRTYPTARDGVEHRAIEHAFAAPGYKTHRQAQRRALTPGLTYDVIATAYRQYDSTFPAERLQQIGGVLRAAAESGSYDEAFTQLFQHGGLVIGEFHHKPDAFQFASKYMADMKRAGLSRFVCEAFPQDIQGEIDEFVNGMGDTMDNALYDNVRALDRNRDTTGQIKHHSLETFLWAAREHHVQVIAAEHPAAYYSSGAGRITEPLGAAKYDHEKRLARYNRVAVTGTPQNSTEVAASVDVHITGGGHANTSDYGHPGIAQLTGYPAVSVMLANGGGYLMSLLPEERDKRLTDIPTHPPIPATSPSSSSRLTTSPVRRHQQQKQEHTSTGGIPID